MAVIWLSILLLGLAVAGISIKILLKKGGKFSGTCASNNPLFNKDGQRCHVCGAAPEESCKAQRTS